MLRKIVSGGQSGADRAGLDFAISTGLEHGGFVPRGRKAEDGREEEPERLLAILAKLAPLTGYLIRREANWHDPAAEAEIESDIFVKVRRASCDSSPAIPSILISAPLSTIPSSAT